MIKIVCAWCGKDLGEKEGTVEGWEGPGLPVSHTCCEDCFKKLRASAQARKKEDKNG